ncbi:MAG TPA: ATP-binding protein [Deltaproteobacteria bacterium]|nr:ATP-binding protein [Deltaproteobacteria bacterium]
MKEEPSINSRGGNLALNRTPRRPSDIGKVIEESLTRLNAPDNIAITLSLNLADTMAWIDRALVLETLVNLETNAVEAMPSGGELSLDAKDDGQRIVITLKDTGRGIPPENMDQIFIPYFTTKPAGIGLGIPLAYAAVKAHAGTMEVESNADPDQGPTGTRIVITLPRGGSKTEEKGRLIIHEE